MRAGSSLSVSANQKEQRRDMRHNMCKLEMTPRIYFAPSSDQPHYCAFAFSSFALLPRPASLHLDRPQLQEDRATRSRGTKLLWIAGIACISASTSLALLPYGTVRYGTVPRPVKGCSRYFLCSPHLSFHPTK